MVDCNPFLIFLVTYLLTIMMTIIIASTPKMPKRIYGVLMDCFDSTDMACW